MTSVIAVATIATAAASAATRSSEPSARETPAGSPGRRLSASVPGRLDTQSLGLVDPRLAVALQPAERGVPALARLDALDLGEAGGAELEREVLLVVGVPDAP